MIHEIHAALRRYIIENFLLGDDAGLDHAQSLLQTGVVDSTGILELVTFVEETYGITVADEEMVPENLDTLDNLGVFVLRKLASSSASAPRVAPAPAPLPVAAPQ